MTDNIYMFFLSSRRRHTRWPRDCSSDVCSSDHQLDGYSALHPPTPPARTNWTVTAHSTRPHHPHEPIGRLQRTPPAHTKHTNKFDGYSARICRSTRKDKEQKSEVYKKQQ